MPDVRLANPPDLTPVKLAIVVSPQLSTDLSRYAELYAEAYGISGAIVDLIPPILVTFLEQDREFKERRAKAGDK